MATLTDYPFEVRPLAEGDGGGYLVSFPDFAECISDGEPIEEAVANGRRSKGDDRRARGQEASRARPKQIKRDQGPMALP